MRQRGADSLGGPCEDAVGHDATMQPVLRLQLGFAVRVCS